MFSNTKRLFLLTLNTVFASLLFVGVAGMTPAQAEILNNGLFKGIEYCDDGQDLGIAEKRKFKDPFEVDINRSGTDISATVTASDASVFVLNGNILAKNAKSGVFQLFGQNSFTAELAMNGKYKLNKDESLKIISGAFQGQDGFSRCIFAGKFKAK
jgi:hypothetical protein